MTPPPRPVDLHVHTTASDGAYSPAEIVRLAILAGLDAIAITDHDSMNGVDEALAAAAGTGLMVIPGVELSTDIPRGEIHLLGYYLDPRQPELGELLTTLRTARFERARGMVEKLNALGMALSWERVQSMANGASVGRPHLALAMVEAGFVSSAQDAFSLYIGHEGPAYVERYKLTPESATALVTRLGGLPVLAHPSFIPDLDRLLPSLVRAGLAGIEVYYTGYSPETTRYLQSKARRFGLAETGGSDFHGSPVVPGAVLGGAQVPHSAVEALERRRRAGEG